MAENPAMDPAWLGLAGRVCVITGAGGGIGRLLAAHFAAAGARVVVLDRDERACREVAAELPAAAAAVALACDVADPASVARAAQACRAEAGPCDVLVNNAAILRAGPIATVSFADWNALLAVNLTGYLLCAQHFGRHMTERGRGSMVHVASIAGHLPQSFSGAYSVSKAGVMMLSQQLAVELGEHGVRSNVVSPAMIRTPLSEPFYRDAELLARRTAMVPLRRIGTPADIAAAALFLASDQAAYVSGQELLVDGAVGRSWLGLIPRPGFDRQDHVRT
ncbi:SDR family NAD(P)-dependent oxidoreductase [Chelatococcus reniformis]|nr:SDR family oxidoreductase [Chelatococcus reniformis]